MKHDSQRLRNYLNEIKISFVVGLLIVLMAGCMVYEGEPCHHDRDEHREWHEHEGEEWHR